MQVQPNERIPDYALNEIKKIQAKALTYDEFTKMQRIVKATYDDPRIKKAKKEDREDLIKSIFNAAITKEFPLVKSVQLKANPKIPIKAYAYKLSKFRPEIYLMINDYDKEFQIVDQKMADVYVNNDFEKPDWSLLFP
jgi:hypothetical protein